jgi:amidohydrolase
LADVSCAIALHVFPSLPTGAIALKSGPLLAACDTFQIKIKGTGTHGAFPELGVDAIVLASHIVQAIQTVVSRRKSALEPAIVTIGGIKSATYRTNIVAEEVEIIGTARYFNSDVGAMIKAELTRCCQIAEAMGGSHSMHYTQDNPVLNNNPQIAEIVRKAALCLIPEEQIIPAPMAMGAEDFSFISAAVPSCFIALGALIDSDERTLHSSTFDIDERALPLGAAILAQSAIDCMTAAKLKSP